MFRRVAVNVFLIAVALVLAPALAGAQSLAVVAVTASGDGLLRLAPGDVGAFALAVRNVGISFTSVVATVVNPTLGEVAVLLCRTDPATGVCADDRVLAAGGEIVDIPAGETVTLSVFIGVSPSATSYGGRVYVDFATWGVHGPPPGGVFRTGTVATNSAFLLRPVP